MDDQEKRIAELEKTMREVVGTIEMITKLIGKLIPGEVKCQTKGTN